MNKFFWLVGFAFWTTTSGCASFTVLKSTVEHSPEKPSEELHYVLLKRNGAGVEYLYDCYSRPDGAWEPECKRVRMTKQARRK